MFIEVFVNAVDEHCHGRGDSTQARHQMAVSVGAAALQLAWREIEKAYEMIDDAVELIVCDQACEPGAHL